VRALGGAGEGHLLLGGAAARQPHQRRRPVYRPLPVLRARKKNIYLLSYTVSLSSDDPIRIAEEESESTFGTRHWLSLMAISD
jgi:hypothetical protein